MLPRLPIAIGLLCLSLVASTMAFSPPVDRADGVTLTIEGFPDDSNDERVGVRKVAANQPLEFTVTLKNERAEAVAGTLSLWLNDDWTLQGKAELPLRAEPGASVTTRGTAVAKPTVLNALYPLHAKFSFGSGQNRTELHPIAIFEVQGATRETPAKPARDAKPGEGVLRLDQAVDRRVFLSQKGETRELGVNFSGSDPATGTTVHGETANRGGVSRAGFGIHPPFRGGPGTTWSDFRITLPAGQPATLTFHTSLRDHSASEPASDGTEFKVLVVEQAGRETTAFTRFSMAKTWEPGTVDLTPFAGNSITLRLWTGPGPKNNTTCDHCFWGDPVLTIGKVPSPPNEEQWRARETEATALARAAVTRTDPTAPGSFRLRVNGQAFGAAVVLGQQGMTDAVIAFADGTRFLTYRGFACGIDRAAIGGTAGGQPVMKVETKEENGAWSVLHRVNLTNRDGVTAEVPVRATLRADAGALRISWDMPGVVRNPAGSPRFTKLGIGPAMDPVWRVYAGFGNVIEKPAAFDLTGGGFSLSTRHIGADYPNGLSLLQACDVFPDRLTWQPASNRFALETQHDATFLLVPSAKGAFDAARAYRDLAGFEKGPGVDNLLGRMCLDQWGGDYGDAAAGVAEAARYGVTDAVFVKHVWQRWGYDYRLPEIHPPAGGLEPFLAMREATRKAGMLFCPHDNYIDFYPDASDYSYDHIVFSENGQPVRAWYNKGRGAQSYRWLPHAFRPWMDSNMRQMRDSFRPDSLFIDVFTAIPPFDYHDRAGRFHSRTRTAREWRTAFDSCREILGPGSPMISEAGTDALIGSVDAGQADHFPAKRWLGQFAAADRTPWHDMVTHGKMILFAGGLGPRYSALDWNDHGSKPGQGYGSDDYLSNTILGGRNPMCDGPFSRRAVMTYWLLHDTCDRLARQSFESHQFGPTVQQQHTTFGGGAQAWANRGPGKPWTVADGKQLPEFGFYAKTADTEAGVFLVNDQRAGFARADGVLFADARPPHNPLRRPPVESSVKEVKHLGNGVFEVVYAWNVLDPVAAAHVPFVHLCDPATTTGGERIAFQASMPLDRSLLQKAGAFEVRGKITVPADQPAGSWQIRYGLYRPDTGARLPIGGRCDSDSRVCGGLLTVGKSGGTVTTASHTPEKDSPDERNPDLNVAGKMLDFGPVVTNGAFRLLHAGKGAWQIIPLPGSNPFRAELRLDQLGAKGRKVQAVEKVDPIHASAANPEWQQNANTLLLSCDGQSFACRIRWSP